MTQRFRSVLVPLAVVALVAAGGVTMSLGSVPVACAQTMSSDAFAARSLTCAHGVIAAPQATDSPSPSASPTDSPSPAASATPSPSPSGTAAGSSVLFDQPRVDCTSIADNAGDGKPVLLGGQGLGNDSDLDIVAVNFRTSSADLQAFIRVTSLSSSPAAPFSGHVFSVAFTYYGKKLVLSATSSGDGTGTVDGGTTADLKPKAVFDTKASNVVLTVGRAAVAKATGVPLPDGAVLTGTLATSVATAAAGGPYPADTAQAATPEEQAYTVGDVACFYPPAAVLDVVAEPSGQYSDITVVYVTVSDRDDQPLGDTVVTAVIGGVSGTGVTEADGIAEIDIAVGDKAGQATLVVSFQGSAEVGPSRVATPFTIDPERSILQAKGGRGAVTASLLDDDGQPVPSQPVTFRSGKLSKTVTTSRYGTARATGFTVGSAVSVSYRGAPGWFTAAITVSAKA